MTFEFVQIGEVCDVVSGATPRTSNSEYWDGDIRWVTPKDLSDLGEKYIFDSPRKITQAGLDSCAAKMLPSNSVLLSSRAPIGLVAINTEPVCTNQGFKSLVPKVDQVDSGYLYWWLTANREQLNDKGRGATFKEISKSIVDQLELPLPHKNGKPDLDEQKRIAAILDKADAIRRKRQQALRLTDDFLRSVFLDMFGDPVTNPKGWKTKDLGDVTEQITGFAFTSADYLEPGNGIRLCRGANVLPGRIDWSNRVDWPAERADEFQKFALREGDITIAMDRPWISTGFKIAEITSKDLPALLVQRVARIRAIAPFTNEFLFTLLTTEAFTRHCCPTETLIPHISPRELRSFPTIVPTNDLIEKFSAKRNAISRKLKRMAGSQTCADALFSSLQQRAFRGEL